MSERIYITAVFENVAFIGIAKAGKLKDKNYRMCVFKCIDKNSRFYEKSFRMNVFMEHSFVNKLGHVEQNAHEVIKHNLIPGTVFENLLLVKNKYATPENKLDEYVLSYYNTNVKILKR